MTNSSDKSAKLLLVSSSGGHLKHLTETDSAWENYERVWVSFKQPDVQAALENERVHWAYYPTTRNIKNAIRNLTGKMLYILADSFNVQNEEQQKNFPDSTILHPIF